MGKRNTKEQQREYDARYRERMQKLDFIRPCIYIHRDDAQTLKAFADELNRKRLNDNGKRPSQPTR